MRKNERKLQLHRETLSSLESKALANARVGGNSPAPASAHCPTDWTRPATMEEAVLR